MQDIERDLFLGINQRNNLKLKGDLLELNVGLLSEIVVDDGRPDRLRDRTHGHRNLLAGSDDCLLVVSRKNRRARNRAKSPGRIQQADEGGKVVPQAEKDTRPARSRGGRKWLQFLERKNVQDGRSGISAETGDAESLIVHVHRP